MSDVDKDADPKKSKLENEPDHVAAEPAAAHAEIHADDHHAVSEHGEIVDMIPEDSWQDKFLQLATVCAAIGLIFMMVTWSQIKLAPVVESETGSSHEQHP